MEIVYFLASLYKYIFILSGCIAVIGFGFFIYSIDIRNPEIREKKKNTGYFLMGQVILVLFIFVAISNSIQADYLKHIRKFAGQNNITVSVNNEPLEKELSSILITHLSNLRELPAHHSSPTDAFYVTLFHTNKQNQQDSIRFIFAQDSNIENEYWITVETEKPQDDKKELYLENELGRIQVTEPSLISS
ncbi:hypothetical protein ACE193_08930 [Bernardetia sp. OM2101]|uniref:hypothetical protein n=1 Tax=Bernardetia sp. OM2101 TaxID=3344876 RepID=UPI0035D01D87